MLLIVILDLYHKRLLIAHSTMLLSSDKPHNVKAGDQILVKNIQSSTNSTGLDGKGYNGTFIVDSIDNDKEFKYSNTDVENITHYSWTFTNNTHTRNTLLPRFSRNDNKQISLFIELKLLLLTLREFKMVSIIYLF